MPDQVFEPLSVSVEAEGDMDTIAEFATKLLGEIQSKVPDGRCKALAITNLEQCAMLANKGISHSGG